MRKIVLSLLAATAVICGLAVTSSTANAADNDGDEITIGGVTVDVCHQSSVSGIVSFVNNANGTATDVTADDVTAALGGTLDAFKTAHCAARPGGNWPGTGNGWPGNNGHRWNDRWNGNRYIVLDGGPTVDLCAPQYTTYDSLLNGYRVYDNRLRGLIDNNRFNTYRRSCGSAVVTNNGNCVTFTNDNRRYGDLYNRFVGDRNRALDRARSITSPGGRSITPDEWLQIRLHDGDLNNYRGHWTRTADSLRTICNDPTPPVTIINQVPDNTTSTTPAPTVTETAPAPAPVIINQPNIKVPNTSSGIDSGDGTFPLERG